MAGAKQVRYKWVKLSWQSIVTLSNLSLLGSVGSDPPLPLFESVHSPFLISPPCPLHPMITTMALSQPSLSLLYHSRLHRNNCRRRRCHNRTRSPARRWLAEGKCWVKYCRKLDSFTRRRETYQKYYASRRSCQSNLSRSRRLSRWTKRWHKEFNHRNKPSLLMHAFSYFFIVTPRSIDQNKH